MIITSILLRKKENEGLFVRRTAADFKYTYGATILFANAPIRLNGKSVSYVPDLVVGTIVAVSIALAWMYLREVKNSSKL